MKHRYPLSLLLSALAFALAACTAPDSPPAASASANATPAKTAPALNLQQADFRTIITRAKENIFPAVVYIHCVNENAETGRQQRQTVSGSGVVITADGEVVTNWHVVEKAVEVRCLLNDGRAFPADIIGSDKDTDIALLKLRLGKTDTVSPARLAPDAPLQEGDFVMALGAPWGLNRSVSFGIIACARRYLPESSEYHAWLQTDASISPGNSGGPLVNTDGLIVGINTRGTLMGGDLGFAVPASTVSVVVPRLRQYKDPHWAWIGLQLQPLRDFQRNLYFDGNDGVIVSGTDESSPARAAGLRPNDRLLRVNGVPVRALMEEDLPGIRLQLALLPHDKPATLTLRRAGGELDVIVQPRSKGKVLGEELALKRWDFSLKTINQFETPDLHFQRHEGVYISGISYPGNANDSQLRERDILISVNAQPVTTLEDAERIHKDTLAKFAEGGARRLVIAVLRAGQNRQVVLDISKDYSTP